jgi:SOS-response transcriptional repressor LexA
MPGSQFENRSFGAHPSRFFEPRYDLISFLRLLGSPAVTGQSPKVVLIGPDEATCLEFQRERIGQHARLSLIASSGTLARVSRIIRAKSTGPGEQYYGVPVYTLVMAGGPFADNQDARLIGRVHPPEGLKILTTEQFIARIEGRSMEPRIPSGSYCLMRFFVPGSRSGRTVLVEERKIAECAYTLKQYFRDPKRHGRITLKSENPDQPDIEIDENGESQDQRYAVIAEFVQVLDGPLKWVEPVWGSNDE